MKESFLLFIRRRIVAAVVITCIANVVMFSAILSFTASIPSEQGDIVHTIKNNSNDHDEKGIMHMKMKRQTDKLTMNSKKEVKKVKFKNSRQYKWEIYSNDKGQMDFVPSRRMVDKGSNEGGDITDNNKLTYQKPLNQSKVLSPYVIASKSRKKNATEKINALAKAKNSKVYDKTPTETVHNVSVVKPEQQNNGNRKVPNTFNEEYIKYFWKHPEFQKRNNFRVIQGESSEVKNFHVKTDEVKGRKSENIKGKKADNDIKLQGKTGAKKFADDNEKHKPNNKADVGEEPNKYTSNNKGNHENPEHKEEVRNTGNPHENLPTLNQSPDKKVELAMKSKGMTLHKDISYMTMFPAKGQLGNQMFQLASLLGTADRGNFTPFLPMSVFDLNKIFRLPQGFSRDTDISTFQKFSDYNYTQDISIKLSQNLDIHRNWSLDGYFQSFKYFSHVRDKVRKYLRFHKHILRAAVKFMQTTVPVGHIKIAVHIRRGDIINSHQMWLGRVAATPEYVHRAMQYFQSRYDNITFIVVSDDMKWCKENIKGGNVVYSTSHYNEKGVDLAIISRCDHVIISVGTFGWWGGWLAGGSVVYFNKFPRPGSKLDQIFVPENYYPSNWIALE